MSLYFWVNLVVSFPIVCALAYFLGINAMAIIVVVVAVLGYGYIRFFGGE